MKNTLIFVFCLICFGCSGATQNQKIDDKEYLRHYAPCGGGTGFFGRVNGNEYMEAWVGFSWIKIEGTYYLFIDQHCVSQSGKNDCPLRLYESNSPLIFSREEALKVWKKLNGKSWYNGKLDFISNDDYNRIKQICNGAWEILDTCSELYSVRNYQSILNQVCAKIWLGTYAQNTLPPTSNPETEKAGIVLVVR